LDGWESSIVNRISYPLLKQMKCTGINYRGVLYHGLYREESGLFVVETNVRFGDPEIQPILERLQTDMVPHLMACAEGKELKGLPVLEWDERPCVGIVLASGGYPGDYEKGKEITGIDEANKMKGVHVHAAGIVKKGDKYFTSGGRVALVTAMGGEAGDYAGAIARAKEGCAVINFEGKYMRDDIGFKARDRGA
ncbi:MAG: phosphoribosylglycinamide synthetase C domain-containing protein, partial [Candidatus Aenigmarchaeota archaeon]